MVFGPEMFDGLALGSRLAYLDLPHYISQCASPRRVPLWHHNTDRNWDGSPRPQDIYSQPGARELSLRYSPHSKCEYPSVHRICELFLAEFLFSPRPGIRETNNWKLSTSPCVPLVRAVLPWIWLRTQFFGFQDEILIYIIMNRTRSNTRSARQRHDKLNIPLSPSPIMAFHLQHTRHPPRLSAQRKCDKTFLLPSTCPSFPPFLFLSSHSGNGTSIAATDGNHTSLIST